MGLNWNLKEYKTPMVTRAYMVTPEFAEIVLERYNKVNRTIRQSWVDFLASEMTLGRWQLTHQGIAFDPDDNLIDGQHRLWAIIQSGKTVPMLITHGMAMKLPLTVIDTQSVRKMPEMLSIKERESAVYTFMIRLTRGRGRVSPYDALAVQQSVLGEATRHLIQSCGGASRIWSAAGFKTGAVIAMLEGSDREYVCFNYAALVHRDFTNLAPIAYACWKQYDKRNVNTRSIKDVQLYADALYIFDKNHKYNKMINHSDAYRTRAMAALRSHVVPLLNQKGGK